MERQSNVPYVLTVLAIYIIVTILIIVFIRKSKISKDRKIVAYITTVITPVLGLIFYLIFRYSKKNAITE
jgi:hypothetical protein